MEEGSNYPAPAPPPPSPQITTLEKLSLIKVKCNQRKTICLYHLVLSHTFEKKERRQLFSTFSCLRIFMIHHIFIHTGVFSICYNHFLHSLIAIYNN